ncbi:MAG: hypothetical protein NVS9B10_27290 [Nevskia sp.]
MSAGVMVMNEQAPRTLPRYLVPALIAAALLIAGLVLANRLRPALNRPVTALRIEGAMTRVDAAQITTAVNEEVTPRLFEVDLAALKQRVEALPWVAHARVSRIWPDRIAVRVVERVPFARWGAAGVIDSESRVFTPRAAEIPEGLPLLKAPEGHEAETAATFQGLRRALDDSPFKPSGLALDARGEWRLQTQVGIELRLGQGDPLAKLDLLLGAVRHTLADQLDRVAYIDLRYANGFSVGWVSGRACEASLRTSANGRPAAAASACTEVPSATAGASQQKSGDLLRSPNAKAEETKR